VGKFPHQIGVGGLTVFDLEKSLVNKVLDSNRLTYGPMSKRLEKEFDPWLSFWPVYE
jgi:hypothetical protein